MFQLIYYDELSSYEDLLTKDRVISIHHKKIQVFVIEIFNVKNSPKIVNDLFRSETGNHYNLRLCRDFNPLLRNVVKWYLTILQHCQV